ncbi:bone morphogenetic protein 3 [Synchiropus splendidus]|uniref:bone morphogenetic protein 3 n=1 Tax=Synchiropus splendidus TaxID=270530 RepID=UPI00237EA3D1|nr:bone morphogenetic protein 3 [Synchiropus splendidus]
MVPLSSPLRTDTMSLRSALLALLSSWTFLSPGSSTDFQEFGTGMNLPRQQDAVTEHMRMLYSKYNRAGFSFRDGNTVRSFQAHWGSVHQRHLQIFNLTSLTRFEDVLSATLHVYTGGCSGSGTCARHVPRRHSQVRVVVSCFSSVDQQMRTLGHFWVNVSTTQRVTWQWKDITRLVNRAKHQDRLILSIEVDRKDVLSERMPYILVYANDSAISEPESVVSTLRRPVSGDRHPWNGTALWRRRRSVNVLLPLQNNELPGPEYPYEPVGWDEAGPYESFADKPNRRSRKKTRKNPRHKMALLQFDEQTIKRARKKQLDQPRSCARRYLKVDFADIGWSEWIISPKSFDAFYCAGSCQFPMAKALKPSNHATIQSIVRAVGVVTGVPEPCCVPEKMSSLSILFFDEDKNVVLKVYPNMTVESCACR